jgi:carbamate kinase
MLPQGNGQQAGQIIATYEGVAADIDKELISEKVDEHVIATAVEKVVINF